MKNNSMLIRILSGIVLTIGVLFCGSIGGLVLYGLCALVSAIGIYEYFNAVSNLKEAVQAKSNNEQKQINVKMLRNMTYVLSVVYYLALYFRKADLKYVTGIIFIAMLAYMCLFVANFENCSVAHFSMSFIGFMYVTVMMSCVYIIRIMEDGPHTIWLVFICSWVCDTCAYFSGTMFGKHKMAPVLSPKKSVEGAIGGVLGSAIVGVIYVHFIANIYLGADLNVIHSAVICILGAIASQVGDLFASAIKRNCGIKDYGKLIPGHGGVLDRFDSVIFTAPIVWVVCLIAERF